MIEPERPTAKYIQGRIAFHASQEEWFEFHDQKTLAAWAHTQVIKWREKQQQQPEAPRPARAKVVDMAGRPITV